MDNTTVVLLAGIMAITITVVVAVLGEMDVKASIGKWFQIKVRRPTRGPYGRGRPGIRGPAKLPGKRAQSLIGSTEKSEDSEIYRDIQNLRH